MHDYRITLTLETGLSAKDKFEAMDKVAALLPSTFEFGDARGLLPFDFIEMTAEQIDWETEGRP